MFSRVAVFAEELQTLLSADSYRIDQPPDPYDSIGQTAVGKR